MLRGCGVGEDFKQSRNQLEVRVASHRPQVPSALTCPPDHASSPVGLSPKDSRQR